MFNKVDTERPVGPDTRLHHLRAIPPQSSGELGRFDMALLKSEMPGAPVVPRIIRIIFDARKDDTRGRIVQNGRCQFFAATSNKLITKEEEELLKISKKNPAAIYY